MADPAEEFRKQRKHNSLLLVASARGLYADVTELLHLGSDINCRDKLGYSPVHFAAARGRLDVLTLLWSKAADIDTDTPAGRTPLHAAALSGHTHIATFLLSKGALISAEDSDQCTPLHAAARTGHTEIIKVLMQSGARIDTTDAYGLTPAGAALLNGHLDAVQMLVEWGAKVQETPGGYSLLHLAAGIGRAHAITWLLTRRIGSTPEDSINNKNNKEGVTPLHCAARAADPQSISVLLDSGADPSIKDAAGRLPADCLPSGAEHTENVSRCHQLLIEAVDAAASYDGSFSATSRSQRTHSLSLGASSRASITNSSNKESTEEKSSSLSTQDAFAALSDEDRRSAARRWASIADDKSVIESALKGFPGSKEACHRAQAAASLRRRINIFKALSALRSDHEFQSDMAEPSVAHAVDTLRKDPSQYERYAADPRISSVLEKMRRVHAALQANAQRTMDMADVVVAVDKVENQRVIDKVQLRELEAEFLGNVWAAAAAAAAEDSKGAERGAQYAFEQGRKMKSGENKIGGDGDGDDPIVESTEFSWRAYLKRQLFITVFTLLLAQCLSWWIKRQSLAGVHSEL